MQDTHDLAIKRQGPKPLLQSFQNLFFDPACLPPPGHLTRGHQRRQNLPGLRCPAHHKMPQIPRMPQSVIEGHIQPLLLHFLKIIPDTAQNFSVIFLHNLAVCHGHDIIKASPFVHSKRKRSVLHLIPESKLHLIPIAENRGRSFCRLKQAFSFLLFQHRRKQTPHLPFFDFQTLLIRKRQIGTAAAAPEMGAGTLRLQRRRLQHLHKPSLISPVSRLVDGSPHLLPRQGVFHDAGALPADYDPLIWKIHALYYALYDLTFFHTVLRF